MQDPAKTFLSTTNVNGTPQYMAPEQFAGARCDEKVDVFALATILNECTTRRPPWREFNNAFQVRLGFPDCQCSSSITANFPHIPCMHGRHGDSCLWYATICMPGGYTEAENTRLFWDGKIP